MSAAGGDESVEEYEEVDALDDSDDDFAYEEVDIEDIEDDDLLAGDDEDLETAIRAAVAVSPRVECSDCPEDLNGDGVVNGADFGILLASWGSCSGW